MANYVTASGRVRETGHLRTRPHRDGKAHVKGVYHRGGFFATHSLGVTEATYDRPKGERIVVLSEAPLEHITAWQVARFTPVVLPAGEHYSERKRGGCTLDGSIHVAKYGRNVPKR